MCPAADYSPLTSVWLLFVGVAIAIAVLCGGDAENCGKQGAPNGSANRNSIHGAGYQNNGANTVELSKTGPESIIND